ncbi:Vacuolar protein sorting-associated protein 17 [Ophidiomyces ophidiicola]|uniref:Vacuolar protein sorting-associated protein 17 n=1 Tax=Ophidiomyces ophidiicola TaxID=1387563 RepID=A0ACB8V0K3_9EURO|nr:Vacuolar protein sorting-associated protein 17 [Ophidiomyces ophidiicola]KAI1912120.1 Vacuolar protein sorting-associated protein 17 [Ophidiomyces ophidiicola]KAI1921777.1 Vacuolar protein sorting-associated protein 17 [Ophidiomyces ophidiicola]KAI1925407.1 Vacuolar protein sorting-associated protein 17 [Ophidiomyces ophidiicola]KAI1944237.1 Vacuolar protein sorting-associated protein 17 [Ophidiomyces ophidiicola]KAI1949351.1 Vacuolar protein sorting-associated protein 17 [Ophidiomyces ophi
MDYSSLSQDSDHHSGASPWGSSSPRADRSFPSSVGEVPPSPFPSQHDSPYTDTAGDLRPASASDSNSPGLVERFHGTQINETDNAEGGSGWAHSQASQHQPPPRAQAPARYQTGARHHARQPAPQYKLQAKITALERTGKKDPILRFDVHTNIPKFRTTQFRDVRRTHSEFCKLADHLISSNPEAIVPAVPPPLTPAGAGTDEDEIRIKTSMQRWLNYVCSNEVLMHDDEIILFVESDFGYSPVVRMRQPATGVRRKYLKQFAPPPDDTPELLDARPVVKRFYLGTMDAGQKVDRVVKARRGLALAESDLGVKLGQMNVQETHPGLANAYRKLGKVIQTVGDYHAAQGTAEATTFGDPLNYHSSDALIVKETLTNRHILLRELIQAQQATRSKRAAADRLKSSSSVRGEKVDEAIAAMEEAIQHENYLTEKTQRVTNNLLQEKRRWFNRTADDVLLSIKEYTIRQIEFERRTLSTLESVRADIRAIDSSGGLSRLGRESHPAARRASLASSQGPKGDAWSGVPRRGDSLSRSISGSLIPSLPEDDEESAGDSRKGNTRSRSGTMEDDEDRVDAKNAASRLATSTF